MPEVKTTHEQDAAADFVSAKYGRCVVEPSRLYHATRCVVITGLRDDIECSRWTIRPDGAVSNVGWFDAALGEYLKTIRPQRKPLLVPPSTVPEG